MRIRGIVAVAAALSCLIGCSCLLGCSQKSEAERLAAAELATIYQCSADGNCVHTHDKSLVELRSELAKRPDDLVLRTQVIHQALGEKHPKIAIEQCHELLKMDPENEYAISHLATAHAEHGDLNKAMYYGAKNLAKHPSAFNHLVVAHIFYRQGRVEQARKMFQKGLDLDPGNPEALEGLRRCK